MPVTYINVAGNRQTADPITYSITPGVGANVVCAFLMPNNATVGVNSVTYDGNAMSLIESSASGTRRTFIAWIAIPGVGAAKDVVFDLTASVEARAYVVALGGVDTTREPVHTSNTWSGTAGSVSLVPDKEDGIILFGCNSGSGTGGGINGFGAGQTIVGNNDEGLWSTGCTREPNTNDLTSNTQSLTDETTTGSMAAVFFAPWLPKALVA